MGNGTLAVTVPRLSCHKILKMYGLEVVKSVDQMKGNQ